MRVMVLVKANRESEAGRCRARSSSPTHAHRPWTDSRRRRHPLLRAVARTDVCTRRANRAW